MTTMTTHESTATPHDTTADEAASQRPTRRSGRRRRWTGLAFCAPLLLLVAALVVWPIISLVRYSFTDYGGLTDPVWVGLKNYRFLIRWQDFHRIVLNNVVILLGLLIWVSVPFVLAIILFGRRGANVVRTILFIPAMLSPIIVGNVFRIILADDGPVNSSLRAVGLGAIAPGWLSDGDFVLVTLALVICWATMGSGILFYTSGLSAISPSYIEAAKLDGANWRQIVWYIYRPALRPITRFWTLLLTVTTVTGFFPWVYGLTLGGPGVSSTTLDFAVYLTLNQGNQLGRGAAIAVVSVVLVLLVLSGQSVMRLVRKDGDWS